MSSLVEGELLWRDRTAFDIEIGDADFAFANVVFNDAKVTGLRSPLLPGSIRWRTKVCGGISRRASLKRSATEMSGPTRDVASGRDPFPPVTKTTNDKETSQ